MTNPYTAPAANIGKNGTVANRGHGDNFGTIIRRWERLRLMYNAFLTIVVLLLTIVFFPTLLGDFRFWLCLVAGASIANLCFFTGPAIEGYGTHFRLWQPAFTIVLFLAGLGLATLLAVGSVAAYAYRNF